MNSMIILANGFLPIATNILLVIMVAVALLLCLVVLMQRPKQEGLGAAFGGGMTDQAFGARTTDVLQKGTVWLGTLFFMLALSLQILVAAQNSSQNIEEKVEPAEFEKATPVPVPVPVIPSPVEIPLPTEAPASEAAVPEATEEVAPESTDSGDAPTDQPAPEEATPAEPAEATPTE